MLASLVSSFAASALVAGLASAQTVDPIVAYGSKFFYKTNGTQFYIKGVAYQPDVQTTSTTGFTDPLGDISTCQRDLPYLQALDTNVVRIYSVDLSQDHTACMNLFAGADIYVLLDLQTPDQSIVSDTPAWNVDLYNHYTEVVDAFANYTNILGFVAGNEVVTQPNQTIAAPFVKAAVRDMKSYISSKNYRNISVGYATNDNPYIRTNLANYMNCGDQTDAIDFWGYNVYSWCGTSTFEQSGYQIRTEEFQNYSVPAFFAEYGCIHPAPRIFQEVGTIYGPQMEDVWSGAIVYEYFEDVNNYGLVTVESNGQVSTLVDYNNFEKTITAVTPTGTNMASYTPSNAPQACPTSQVNWTIADAPLPPQPNAALCDCMYSAISCLPAPNLSNDTYGALFGQVCGAENGKYCVGISANSTTGTYGIYGMCPPQQQLGFVLDQYYRGQSGSQGASACAFAGSATLTSAAKPTGTCASLLSGVGNANTPISSGGSSPTTGSGSGGSASAKSGSVSGSHGAAARMHSIGGFELGNIFAVGVAQLALVSALGMLLL